MIKYKIFRGRVLRVRTHKGFIENTTIKRNNILHNRSFIGAGFTRGSS